MMYLWVSCSCFIGSFFEVFYRISYHPSLSEPIIRNLTDVVHHAVEQPLYVYLDPASQGEPVKPFVGADVCEHRLHDGHPQRIDPAALLTLDLFYHDFGEVITVRSEGNAQASWSTAVSIETFTPYRAILAVLFLRSIHSIYYTGTSMTLHLLAQHLPLGALILIVLFIVPKVLQSIMGPGRPTLPTCQWA